MSHISNETIEGNLILDDDLEFAGLVTGNIIVPSGRKLILRGTVAGSVEVARGASARIDGAVNKTVINHGGDVVINGVVGAVDDTALDTETKVSITAKIGK